MDKVAIATTDGPLIGVILAMLFSSGLLEKPQDAFKDTEANTVYNVAVFATAKL